MDNLNLNGGQVLNLSSKNQRNMNNSGSGERLKPSSSSSSLNKSAQQLQSQMPGFDMLASLGNGDINAAMAALGANLPLDNTFAHLNALSQLTQFASNPKLAAAAMLQFQQQQLMNQAASSPILAPPSPSPLPQMSNSQLQSPLIQSSHNSQSNASLVSMASAQPMSSSSNKQNHSRYQQLLTIIDEMGRDIRNTYLGNKNSSERLKRAIASARILVKDCQLECERNTKN